MSIKLMYITNRIDVAKIADNVGVDRIFVDLERLGKAERQRGMDSVKSQHTVEDIKNIRREIKHAELLVRINPMHEATEEFCSSAEEIEQVIEAGADIIMLDNMSIDDMKTAVELCRGKAETECSGNVTKENVAKLTCIGVNYISSGALTHSAPILDLSLKNLHAI